MLERVLCVLQRRLQEFYGLEAAPSVHDFVRVGGPSDREVLLVKQAGDAVEMMLMVPRCPAREVMVPSGLGDGYLQLIEGVSHFVLLAERIRTGLPTSQLELELQAEVDKLVLVDGALRLAPDRLARLHARLYGGARFLHSADTVEGQRYRLATAAAARFTSRLGQLSARSQRDSLLRRFYQCGLTDKLAMAQAA